MYEGSFSIPETLWHGISHIHTAEGAFLPSVQTESCDDLLSTQSAVHDLDSILESANCHIQMCQKACKQFHRKYNCRLILKSKPSNSLA